jgi:hypothetical protein
MSASNQRKVLAAVFRLCSRHDQILAAKGLMTINYFTREPVEYGRGYRADIGLPNSTCLRAPGKALHKHLCLICRKIGAWLNYTDRRTPAYNIKRTLHPGRYQ